MNISRIDNNQTNTSFGALKSLKFIGEFKKSPLAQEKLLDVFESSVSLQRFSREFDVDVVFNAFKDINNRIQSVLELSYKSVADDSETLLKKIKRIFKRERLIIIDGYDLCAYSVDESANVLARNMNKSWGIFDYKVSVSERISCQKSLISKPERIELEKKLEQLPMYKAKQAEINERIENMLTTQKTKRG